MPKESYPGEKSMILMTEKLLMEEHLSYALPHTPRFRRAPVRINWNLCLQEQSGCKTTGEWGFMRNTNELETSITFPNHRSTIPKQSKQPKASDGIYIKQTSIFTKSLSTSRPGRLSSWGVVFQDLF